MTDPNSSITVEGFVVGGTDNTVQVVLPPYLLEFAQADVFAMDELPPLPLQNTAVCVAARLTLRRGARIMAMRSAAELESRMWIRRRPFAFVTRPTEPDLTGESAYARREQDFFANLGLEG